MTDEPNIIKMDAKRDVDRQRFATEAQRERVEGEIYEVEDEENLPGVVKRDAEVLDDHRSYLQVFFERPSDELVESNEAFEHVVFSHCGLYAPLNALILELVPPSGIGISERSSDKYLPDNCVRIITDVELDEIDILDLHDQYKGNYTKGVDFVNQILEEVGVITSEEKEEIEHADDLFMTLSDLKIEPHDAAEYFRAEKAKPEVIELEEDEDDVDESESVVRVSSVHEAPDDVITHCDPEIGLYYIDQKNDDPSDTKEEAAEEGTFEYPDAGAEDAPEEVQEAVQRFRSEIPEEVKAEDALLYWLLGTGTPAYKMSKADAEYQSHPEGAEYCGSCEYAYLSNESGDLICSKVRGEVDWMGWCRLWDETEPNEILDDALSPPESREEAMEMDWSPVAIIETMAKSMDLDVFQILAPPDGDYEDEILGIGVDFPNHDVYVDWNLEAFGDDQLDNAHVSIYGSLEDLAQVTDGEIEHLDNVTSLERSEPQVVEVDVQKGADPDDIRKEAGIEIEDVSSISFKLDEAYKSLFWDDEVQKERMFDGDGDVDGDIQDWVEAVLEVGDPMADPTQYDAMSAAGVEMVQREIEQSLLQHQGWSLKSIQERVQNRVRWLDNRQAKTIVLMEVQSVMNAARDAAYRARPDFDQMIFRWDGPDPPGSEVCKEIVDEIESRGGAVAYEVLLSILEEKASDLQDKGGKPGRARDLVPHFGCRRTIMEVDPSDVRS